MKYLKISPSSNLQAYVMCYYIWEHDQPLSAPLEVNSPPNGLGGMVFNYGDPYYTLQENGKWERVPFCFVAGQFTRNYSIRLSGNIGMIGVAFWPADLSYILGIPMVEFTGQRIALNLVLGKETAVLEHRILACQTTCERIQVLEKFLFTKIRKANLKPDMVDYAVEIIIQKKGILSISHLSDELCISPRQFRRRFTEKVGITPKMCGRIKRFNYVTNLTVNTFANWMDMVHEYGYYDQAHFIRDFSDFSGKSPTEFMHYNRKMAQLIGA